VILQGGLGGEPKDIGTVCEGPPSQLLLIAGEALRQVAAGSSLPDKAGVGDPVKAQLNQGGGERAGKAGCVHDGSEICEFALGRTASSERPLAERAHRRKPLPSQRRDGQSQCKLRGADPIDAGAR